MILKITIGSIILLGGLGYMIYEFLLKKNDKSKIYLNLKHCVVPKEWEEIRDRAWNKASTILSTQSITPHTKCKKIIIEKGMQLNPKTGQWGRRTSNGFWYAGLGGTYKIQIVATPSKAPYDRSLAILAHEAGETILNLNPVWSTKSPGERNKFLWSLGL